MKYENTDNESFEPKLSAPENSFPNKDGLKKTVTDLTDSQIEFLSVAYLENDLSDEQIEELEENLNHDNANRIIFKSFQKIKLKPVPGGYKHRNSLKKLTAGQKVLRITTATLSAAATIAILIISYIFVPDLISYRKNQASSEILPDNTPITLLIAENKPIIKQAEPAVITPKKIQENTNVVYAAEVPPISDPIISEPVVMNTQPIEYASASAYPGIDFMAPQLSLMRSNTIFIAKVSDDDRGPVRRFLASTFRQRVLKEETFSDDKLRPFEFARASVDGLNRLLDWEMEFKETLDDSGELKSVYFSSTLLTFNTPLRKTEE